MITAEFLREAVRRVVEQALAVVTNTFVVEIGDERYFNAYVQACVEDAPDLHLELMHESFSFLPLTEFAERTLMDLGWYEPNEDFPNYWQRVSREEMSDQAIADLLIRSLEQVYDIFEYWKRSPAILVLPGTVAAKALSGTPFEIVGIR